MEWLLKTFKGKIQVSNSQNLKTGNTPLHGCLVVSSLWFDWFAVAAAYGHEIVVGLLLIAGADVDVKNAAGETPLDRQAVLTRHIFEVFGKKGSAGVSREVTKARKREEKKGKGKGKKGVKEPDVFLYFLENGWVLLYFSLLSIYKR